MATLVKTRTRVVVANDDERLNENIGDDIPDPFPLAVVELHGHDEGAVDAAIVGEDVRTEVEASKTIEVGMFSLM